MWYFKSYEIIGYKQKNKMISFLEVVKHLGGECFTQNSQNKDPWLDEKSISWNKYSGWAALRSAVQGSCTFSGGVKWNDFNMATSTNTIQ